MPAGGSRCAGAGLYGYEREHEGGEDHSVVCGDSEYGCVEKGINESDEKFYYIVQRVVRIRHRITDAKHKQYSRV